MSRFCRRGFTLIEALFAMVVIVIGMVAVISLLQNGIANITQASIQMRAAVLATNCMEEIKSFGYDNLPASDTVASIAAANPGKVTDFPAPFIGTVTVSNVSEDLDGDGDNDYEDKGGASMLRQIVVEVSAVGSRLKPVTFRTRLAD